jgi:hypothetical protein
MKAFIFAVVAMVIVAIAGALFLATQQRTTAEAFSSASVRLTDPGHNLIVEQVALRADHEQRDKATPQ